MAQKRCGATLPRMPQAPRSSGCTQSEPGVCDDALTDAVRVVGAA
eukprot:CAMPEP_0174940946 /NCGR_PEP_ID=MMETSP1355-20121228/70496_1 /TAXON_ID=464990 /ORGANISM="Hemiselmis tepida, Strain CCMP443" /LENGTH=44 /DNA_ID= /DNA_START= /DNA_END= /DNA_ORIENTATION=